MDGIHPLVHPFYMLVRPYVNTHFYYSGTVILNANVAFLSIQNVNNPSDKSRSPAQLASYLSVVTSAGAIILGLLLVRQNRTKSRETPEQAVSLSSLNSLSVLRMIPGSVFGQNVSP